MILFKYIFNSFLYNYIVFIEGERIMLEKIFKLKEKGTTVKTEVIAGITTFLAI